MANPSDEEAGRSDYSIGFWDVIRHRLLMRVQDPWWYPIYDAFPGNSLGLHAHRRLRAGKRAVPQRMSITSFRCTDTSLLSYRHVSQQL